MKIIDRFILKQYLLTFFFCLLMLTVIVVVVDISEKADEFSQYKLSTLQIITQYYFGFIPRIDAMLFPLFVFISVIFFTSKMAGRSEVIAILSSGVNFRRYMAPFFAGGLILSAFLWYGYRSVVPPANKLWGDFHKKYLDNNSGIPAPQNSSYKQNIYFRLDADHYAGLRSYDTISRTGSGFFIQQIKNNQLLYNLRASSLSWDTSRHQWRLYNVSERRVNPIDETLTFTPQKFVSYNFRPMDLRKDDYLMEQMTTPDLNDFIDREKSRGSEILSTLLVERYNRDAIPASVFILTVIGVSLASRRVRGGSGAHLALGVLLSFIYILLSRLSFVFATKGSFTPFIAAWTPNVIFGLLAIFLYRRAAA